MLHVQPIGQESAYYKLGPVFSWPDGLALSVTLLKKNKRDSIDYGFPPGDGARNAVGDRNCYHLNVVGTIDWAETPAISTVDTSRGIPGYSAISVYCPNRVVNDVGRMLIEFGKSYSYELATTNSQRFGGIDYQFTNIKMNIVSTDDHIHLETSWEKTLTYAGTSKIYAKYLYSSYMDFVLGIPSTGGGTIITYAGSSYSAKIHGGTVSGMANFNPSFTRCAEPNLDCGSIEQLMSPFLETVISSHPPMSLDEEGEVAVDCINNCHTLDLNMIAFGIDIKNVRQLGTALKSVTEIRDSKTLANAYLANNYGTKLFLSDAITIISTITKHRKKTLFRTMSIARARRSDTVPITQGSLAGLTWNRECNVKLYYEPYDDQLKRLVQSLYDIDVYPSYQNLWDLIPYSFVIDWFVNVEGYFEARDAENYLEQIATKSVCISHRDSLTYIPAKLISSSLRGTFDVVIYHRRSSAVLPKMPTSLSLKPLSGFNHWWEGAALFRQRIR